ncbi:MAG: hypothetical protein E6Q69_05015 [Aquipseudomonas alcaligenes]|uniref:Uncharacterized protein n=1 Tax=Aquipseudomonas alcaligenes TaxID=43263 RepID=A0A5C7WA78_AQUAC|nr:MAG: hypothetical protein E6Q69_05015 [Pseudomonas alcaligenes]
MDKVKEQFLLLGQRWLAMTNGQKKYVAVATIILLAIIDSGVYAFSRFVPVDQQFLTFEQLIIGQIAMAAFTFLTIGFAAIAARRNG